jgi:hypothetical protein
MAVTELFAKVREQENFTCRAEGASDREIESMEAKLGVVLPKPYVAFLREFGYAWWFGHAVFGISDDEEYDALTYTLEAREEELPEEFEPLPRDGVIVERYGGGGYYFLYADDSPRRGQVVLLLDETFWEPEATWNSFEEFLAYLLEDDELEDDE